MMRYRSDLTRRHHTCCKYGAGELDDARMHVSEGAIANPASIFTEDVAYLGLCDISIVYVI